jgi:hypothetical protein
MVRKTRVLSVLTLYSVLLVGCVRQDLPPELKPTAMAAEVLLRVEELQDFTIQLYDSTPKGITAERALVITTFTTMAARTLKQVPSGWQNTLKAGWAESKKQYTPIPGDKVSPIWNIVDKLIGAL